MFIFALGSRATLILGYLTNRVPISGAFGVYIALFGVIKGDIGKSFVL